MKQERCDTFREKSEMSVEVRVGKNAKDNWKILDEASPDDLWFHLDDQPSPYVVLVTSSAEGCHTKTDIVACARMCKSRSKAKHEKRVVVVYTPVSNLRKGRATGEAIIVDESQCRYTRV